MMPLRRGENRPLSASRLAVTVSGASAVDVSAVLLGAGHRVRSDADLVFFNNPVGPGVQYSASTGRGDAVLIDTAGVPADVEAIAITASLDGSGPASFATAGSLQVVVGEEYSFAAEGLGDESALVCVEIYRRGAEWKVRAVGQGYASGLAGIATDFGIDVEGPEASAPAADAAPAPSTPPAAATPVPSQFPPAQAQPPAPPPPPPAPSQPPTQPPTQPPPPPASTPPAATTGAGPMRSDLFDPQHAEVSGAGIQKQGGKMCKVGLNGEVMARSGSMVAYQGEMNFQALGAGGIGNAIKQKLSGEGVPLMKVTGRGDLFLADASADVHLIDLDGSDGLTVNGANVLAFDSTLSYKIQRVQGAAMASNAGLFNCVFTGAGRIALTTDGAPVVLNVDQPTYADPQAAVAWSAGLQTSVKRNDQLGLGTLIGRSTGERFTLAFSGRGFVVVQPSELPPGGLIGGTGGGERSGQGGMLGGFLGQ